MLILNEYLLIIPNYWTKIILIYIKTKEIVQYFEIQTPSLFFVKDNQTIIQIIKVDNYCEIASLKFLDGCFDYCNEKTNKIVSLDESFKRLFINIYMKDNDIESKKINLYFLDENEILFHFYDRYYDNKLGNLNYFTK